MIYLDTSLIVTALTNEPATIAVQAWLGNQLRQQLVVSHWTIAEVSSALSMKVRTSDLTLAGRQAAAARFNQMISTDFGVLNVTSKHFSTAALFAQHHQLGLRASDALHLAIAAEYQTSICSLDRRVMSAGPNLGIATVSPMVAF